MWHDQSQLLRYNLNISFTVVAAWCVHHQSLTSAKDGHTCVEMFFRISQTHTRTHTRTHAHTQHFVVTNPPRLRRKPRGDALGNVGQCPPVFYPRVKLKSEHAKSAHFVTAVLTMQGEVRKKPCTTLTLIPLYNN